VPGLSETFFASPCASLHRRDRISRWITAAARRLGGRTRMQGGDRNPGRIAALSGDRRRRRSGRHRRTRGGRGTRGRVHTLAALEFGVRVGIRMKGRLHISCDASGSILREQFPRARAIIPVILGRIPLAERIRITRNRAVVLLTMYKGRTGDAGHLYPVDATSRSVGETGKRKEREQHDES
jgi:hypothetical protein